MWKVKFKNDTAYYSALLAADIFGYAKPAWTGFTAHLLDGISWEEDIWLS